MKFQMIQMYRVQKTTTEYVYKLYFKWFENRKNDFFTMCGLINLSIMQRML